MRGSRAAALIAQRGSGSIRVVLGGILAFAAGLAGCGSKDADSDVDYAQYVDHTTSWGTDMVRVPAGTFTMGGGIADGDDQYVEHEVTLTHDFWVGQAELTQMQWLRRSGASPSAGEPCDDCPVDQVSWKEGAKYLNALSAEEGLVDCYTNTVSGYQVVLDYVLDPYDCPGYRFLTEAEWEYAARAGVDTVYSGSNHASDVAWWVENSEDHSHPGCGLAPNAWGLCDMSGNVDEWTNDNAGGAAGDGSPTIDPAGPRPAYNRITRGGRWSGDEVDITLVRALGQVYLAGSPGLGLRIARSVIP